MTRKEFGSPAGCTRKKLYIWRLAQFLMQNNKKMSVGELAASLNRNSFRTSYGTHYAGERGTLRLISVTYKWVEAILDLGEEEAEPVATSFVKEDGTYAWKPQDPVPEGEE